MAAWSGASGSSRRLICSEVTDIPFHAALVADIVEQQDGLLITIALDDIQATGVLPDAPESVVTQAQKGAEQHFANYAVRDYRDRTVAMARDDVVERGHHPLTDFGESLAIGQSDQVWLRLPAQIQLTFLPLHVFV
jgi:hypothetical protein